ncbi:hypothetical protein SVIO_110670 [Streptomyces violaceusniger]|uniref:Uncharacterized protein n=1 Tax=Streptomyces violaceusniger TaxID=68280 RepID=A0A4D4LJ01_STRVO|nr:hypothetical protein SVIO_110670 [Streptomyces violaceusniger]
MQCSTDHHNMLLPTAPVDSVQQVEHQERKPARSSTAIVRRFHLRVTPTQTRSIRAVLDLCGEPGLGFPRDVPFATELPPALTTGRVPYEELDRPRSRHRCQNMVLPFSEVGGMT